MKKTVLGTILMSHATCGNTICNRAHYANIRLVLLRPVDRQCLAQVRWYPCVATSHMNDGLGWHTQCENITVLKGSENSRLFKSLNHPDQKISLPSFPPLHSFPRPPSMALTVSGLLQAINHDYTMWIVGAIVIVFGLYWVSIFQGNKALPTRTLLTLYQ